MKFAAAFAAAALTLVAASPATAGEHTREVRVTFADLDLSTAQGQDAFVARIDRAVSRACNPNGLRPLGETARCYEEARANVLTNASGPARTALANAWGADAPAQYASRETVRQ